MSVSRRLGRRIFVSAILAVAAATSAVVSVGGSAAGADTAPAYAVPASDPFYAAPWNIGFIPNGQIIRSRPVPEVKIAMLGWNVDVKAWQVAYRSNDAHDRPILSVTTILVPATRYTGSAPRRPVVAFQTAEDSTGAQCSPSYTLATNSPILTGQEQSLMALALLRGFALAVADWEGPNSGYLVGPQSAHIVLDGIRAAQHFTPSGLSTASPVGVWGYSGGGHATGWTAELQHSYAPDLKIAGIAFGGAPSNLANSFNQLNGGPLVGFALGGLTGLSHGYPEWGLYDMLNAKGRAVYAQVDQKCTSDFVVNVAFTNLKDMTDIPDLLNLPATKAILTSNNLGQNMPVAPIYYYYALVDESIPTADTQNLMKNYCSHGVKVNVQVVLAEHTSTHIVKTPDALTFLEDRFAGKPLTNICKI